MQIRATTPSAAVLRLRRSGGRDGSQLRLDNSRVAAVAAGLAAMVFVAGCDSLGSHGRRQAVGNGGLTTTSLGGAVGPTTVSAAAPDSPQTPSVTTVEKIVTHEYAPAYISRDAGNPANIIGAGVGATAPAGLSGSAAPAALGPAGGLAAPAMLLRETVSERASTQTGVAQRDTSLELGARLANTRGVMWAGLLLLIAGPVVAIRLGWPLNGAIAAATGLLLIVLAQVLPGHEAWLGLALLLLIPVVCYVYYRGHYDKPVADRKSAGAATPDAAAPAAPVTPSSSATSNPVQSS